MRKSLPFFLIALFIGSTALYGQSLENTCWFGVSKNDGTSWEVEYVGTDSIYMTGYNSYGVITNPRFYIGSYLQVDDSLTITFQASHPCGTVPGVYTFMISNNTIYYRVVSDPCQGRPGFYEDSHDHYVCDRYPESTLENSCWFGGHVPTTGHSWMMEFVDQDSVFFTGYPPGGTGYPTYDRTYFGPYEQNHDTITFNYTLSGHPCGTGIGVYTFEILDGYIYWTLVSDPCTDRIPYYTSQLHFDCLFVPDWIGVEELNSGTTEIRIFPNPASDRITIENERHFVANTQILIYDLLGNIHLNEVIDQTEMHIDIAVHQLNSGLYFVKVTDGRSMEWIEKVIIRR
jgi:hypothetical protein